MIQAERHELIRLRDQGLVPDEVMRQVMTVIDVEETVLDATPQWNGEERDEVLTAPDVHQGCEHIRGLECTPRPGSPRGCEECLAQGSQWVHLRMCMTCGHVGCCDSSAHKHAAGHFDETHHPVIRSFEPGEAWRWCFEDAVLG
ncbi:MAG: UBP-type zinc finger domain-containing protein [Nocardioidaceae bacterium]